MRTKIALALFAILAMVAVAGCKQEQPAEAPPAAVAAAAPEEEKKDDGKPVPKFGPSYDETVEYINKNAHGYIGDSRTTTEINPSTSGFCSFVTKARLEGDLVYSQSFEAGKLAGGECTIDRLDMVRCECVGGEKCVRYVGKDTVDRMFTIPVPNARTGKKVVKAMEHLIEMCGGSKDLF